MSAQQKKNQTTQDDRYSNQAPLSSPPYHKEAERVTSNPDTIPDQVPDTHPQPVSNDDQNRIHEPVPQAPGVPENDPDKIPVPQKL